MGEFIESMPRFKNVMVVDDNEIDRYIAEGVILRNKFASRVICVEGVTDALEYLEANCNKPDELPKVIFLDINMPELNGFDFLARYDNLPEQIKSNCIIMMLTTSLDSNDKMAADKNKYISMFLNKPLNREKLEMIK